MGIEYSITSNEFERERMEQLLVKSTSLFNECVHNVSSEEIEMRFSSDNDMPDISIYIEHNGILFVYNSGYEKAWAVFGLLVSNMTEHFNGVVVNEL